jgi:hypothetical protein
MRKTKHALAILLTTTIVSSVWASNACFNAVYNPSGGLLLESPNAMKLNSILLLNENEIRQAKNRLSHSEEVKKVERKTDKKVETDFDEILFTEEQAKQWTKELIKSNFLLGSFHEGIWLYSAYQALDIKVPSSFGRPAIGYTEVTRETLKPIYEAFEIKSSANVAAVNKISRLEKSFYTQTLQLHEWKNLSSGARETIYREKLDNFFNETPISRDGFFKQMELLSSIASTPEGDSFLNFILKRSGVAMAKSIKSNRSIIGEASLMTLSAVGVGLGSFFLGDASLATTAMLSGGGFLVSGIPATIVNHTALSRIKGMGSRFKSRRDMVRTLGDSTFQQKIDTTTKEIEKLDHEETADDFSFALIQKEIERGLQDNPILVPAWGHHLSSGIQALISRNKKLKKRYELIVKDADQILKKLSEKEGSTSGGISTDALQKINSVSREDLISVLIDFHSIKMDYLALALALDKYILALENLRQSPDVNQAHLKIIDDKLTGLKQFAGILEIAATKLNTQSALVISTTQSINELDTSLHIERLQELLND